MNFSFNKKQISTIYKWFILSNVTFLVLAFLYALFDSWQEASTTIFFRGSEHSKFTDYGLTRIYYNWHPTYVSLFSNFSLLLILSKKLNVVKWVKYSIVGFLAISIVALKSMIGLFALAVVLSLSIALSKGISFRSIFLSLVALFVLSLVLFTNPFKIEKIERLKNIKISKTDVIEESNSLNIRLVKWDASVEVFKKNKWFGVSPYYVKHELSKQYKKGNHARAEKRKFGPHNQYLNVLISFGLLGFIIFIFVFFFPLIKSINHEVFFGLILLFSIFSLTEDVLDRQQGILFFSFFYVAMLNFKKKVKSS